MKTLTYLPTLLALTIQIMVTGQTQNNQDRKIRIDIMSPKEPVKMNYVNSNITLSMSEYTQLLEQANNLKINARQLREEAFSVETQSLQKQIQASEFSSRISLQKFEQNKAIILELFNNVSKNHINYTKAQGSYSEAERLMKLAKEIREEANAQFTPQAKYGSMSNAEEKEALALNKQSEVLNLLKDNSPQLVQVVESSEVVRHTFTNTSESLLANALQQSQDLKITAQQLRLNALNSSPNQKVVLINEAIGLENDYALKQLEVSILKSKIGYAQFDENRRLIMLLMEQVKDEVVLNRGAQINAEAERLMKIGKEMREEANAQFTFAAKFGEMSNAEETETFALAKQKESIQILDKGRLKGVVASR